MTWFILGVEMADFDLGVCLRAERFVSDQDLVKAIAKVFKTFDGVENLSAEQRDGIANFIRRHDVFLDSASNYIIWATAITKKVQL